jgi:type IV pilus assembly protein PilC
MNELLQQVNQPDALQGLLNVLLGFIIYLLVGLLPALVLLYLIYFLLTLPLRRNERARLFLDLLELGLQSGRSPEIALTDVATSKDSALGDKFQLLATYLQQGIPLGHALEFVPRLLPPQVRAMLRTGARLGNLQKVLPACRLSLHGGISEVRGALNYLVILSFLATPFAVAIPIILKVKVIPSFEAIFAGMLEGRSLPEFTRFILATSSYIAAVQVLIFTLVWFLTICYLGGPRLRAWFGRILPGGGKLVDWVLFSLPWRRKRLQRDFSAMLAVLLESGVPEAEAIFFAGESTANTVLSRRAERAGALLVQGVKLPEAVGVLDDSGELQWRLANALRGTGGFVKALTGWHEALDAKAFQLEQTAAQITTTAFVLINGLIIGGIVIGMFLPLIQLLNQATLW